MKRRDFLLFGLGTLGAIAMPTALNKRPALAAQLSLDSNDIYWLCSKAWLRMLAHAEGLGTLGTEAYRTTYRYRKFQSFGDHPRIDIPIPGDPLGRTSDAAGPYQILSTTWDKQRRNHPEIWLKDEPEFSPSNQDRCALSLSHDTGGSAALLQGASVLNGHLSVSYTAFKRAIYADSSEWAALPGHDIGKDSGQSTRPLWYLWDAFQWHLWNYCGYYRRIAPPIEPQVFTSHFGKRWGDFHSGIDIAAAIGTAVRSPEKARITKVSRDDRSGLYVVLSPLGFPEIEQSYCHLSEALVRRGDTVAAGHVIGKSGATGRVTGPHLHLGMWIDGGLIDPYRYLMMSEWF